MPKLGLGLSLPQTKAAGLSLDPDALAYLTAVETADGQPLETGVKVAINNFVLGCKADGTWTSLVGSCIMAGARTVAGAITPLRGAAPTNNFFVAGDYSRTLGLLGNDTDKYLNTGYDNNDTTNFPQNNSHISCYVSASQTDAAGTFVGGVNVANGNKMSLLYTSATSIIARNRALLGSIAAVTPIGFQGTARSNSANFFRRFTSSAGISESTLSSTSGAPTSDLLGVFAAGNGTNFSNARMSFYSIGKSLTLASLDSRVTTLMTTLASVIP